MYEVRSMGRRESGRTIRSALARLTGVRRICYTGDGEHVDGGTVTATRPDGRVLCEAVVYHPKA